MKKLLQQCLVAFNLIPNKGFTFNGVCMDTEELATKIDRTLKRLPKTDEEITTFFEISKAMPNGFTCWNETYYEIVRNLIEHEADPNSISARFKEEKGLSTLYELAVLLTNQFEKANQTEIPDGEFIETVADFVRAANMKFVADHPATSTVNS